MRAADVMTTDVITVGPDARVVEVAETLLASRISAVPVVGERGELVGIVSEGDLMRRSETRTDRHLAWWLEALVGRTTLANDYVQALAQKVADIMTRNVITATPDTSSSGWRLCPLERTHGWRPCGVVLSQNTFKASTRRSRSSNVATNASGFPVGQFLLAKPGIAPVDATFSGRAEIDATICGVAGQV